MKFATASMLFLLAALALGIGILSRPVRQQDERLASLQKEKMELEALRAENEKLKGIRVDDAELIRLRQENIELLKLRNEVSQLNQSRQSQESQEPEAGRQLRNENERLQQQIRELQALPDRATCIHGLELIDAAKKQWAEKNGLEKGDLLMLDDLAPFFPDGIPTCPDGGHYNINRIGSPPSCSISGHSIP
jgi:TolA-binding protein